MKPESESLSGRKNIAKKKQLINYVRISNLKHNFMKPMHIYTYTPSKKYIM